jgi:hypothetical protein
MAAAAVVLRRSRGNPILQDRQPVSKDMDCDDELHAAIRQEGYRGKKTKAPLGTKIDPHINISPDSLMGKMPKGDKVVKEGILKKLGGDNEWKPVHVAITAVGIFLSRPNEDLLRDLIPLYEVLEVKKKLRFDPSSSITDQSSRRPEPSASCAKLNISSLMTRNKFAADDDTTDDDGHIFQIRTIEDGYNSGRVYLLRTESEEGCNAWIQSIRSGVTQAVMLKEAGPGLFRKTQYRVARFYRSVGLQSFVAILIFLSFLANILQTEFMSDGSDEAFDKLEYFFTIAFTVELAINLFANLFSPFFKVRLLISALSSDHHLEPEAIHQCSLCDKLRISPADAKVTEKYHGLPRSP